MIARSLTKDVLCKVYYRVIVNKTMAQNNKTHTHLAKKTTKRAGSSNKKVSNQKFSFLSRFMPRSRKGVIRSALAVIVLIAIVGAIPFPYAFAKSATVSFSTDTKENAGLELGDSKVLQEGRDGSKIVNVESLQSMWGRLFGLQPLQQKEKTSTITKTPINKSVANGTKKYQYMLCSDGSYRYYTDERFKDPQTGFTSKSEDGCKKNAQGEMIRLSDTASGSESATSTSGKSPTVTVRDGCTYTSIPYKTVYRDVSWLNKGETRVSKGSDGTKSSCGWSTNPIDEEILSGTSEPSSGFSPPANTSNQDFAAYERCQSSYSSAMSQIQANESQGMGGTAELKRQVESEFSRCKRAAGF